MLGWLPLGGKHRKKEGKWEEERPLAASHAIVPVNCLVLVLGGNLVLVFWASIPALLTTSFRGGDGRTRMWEILTIE